APGAGQTEAREAKTGTHIRGRPPTGPAPAAGALIEPGPPSSLSRAARAPPPGDPALLKSDDLSPPAKGLATLVPSLAADLRQLAAIAPSPIPIVLQGESGTGKEVAAAAAHRLSGRAGPFLPVNCGGLPQSLVESELFGSRKGSFSGADKDRPGLVRSADRGTLFLDEIGELPSSAQAALLRVLQDGEVLQIGATHPIRVDVRVLAATNRDLEMLVRREQFRADLLARISGFTAWLPPWRDPRAGLGLL